MSAAYDTGHDVLQTYLDQIKHFQPLSFEDEQKYAKNYKKKQDKESLDRLMESYLRLVVKVALGYKGYGLPMGELIQEGNIGLMQAISKFDPSKGFRLSTYAMWWIRAAIQEYVLNNWSLVKIGTTSTQKRLFFNLRKLRNQLREMSTGDDLSHQAAEKIAEKLKVKKDDVVNMEQRLMHGDQSLNVTIGGEDSDGDEWQSMLASNGPSQEEIYARNETRDQRRQALHKALQALDERERIIFSARNLYDGDSLPTLEDLSQKFGISRERVRQLEKRAFEKIQQMMCSS